MKKILISVCIGMAAALALSISVFAAGDSANSELGWQTVDGNTVYIKEDGKPATEDMNIDGIRYCFDSEGVCTGRYTGWTKSSEGRRYYSDGVLAENKWLKATNGNRYYAGEDGIMATGWFKAEEGKGLQGWRYFNEKGVMYTGRVTIKGSEYEFSQEGVLEQMDVETSISSHFAKVEKNAPSGLFGGLYYDDGMVIIKSTNVKKMQAYMNRKFPNSIDYVISKCRYTQKQLDAVMDKLTKKLGEMNILSTCTDSEENCVIVGVTELTDELKSFVGGIKNGECVKYEIVSGESGEDTMESVESGEDTTESVESGEDTTESGESGEDTVKTEASLPWKISEPKISHEETPENGVTLELKADSLTETGAEFIMSNLSEKTVIAGTDFTVEILRDGRWNYIDIGMVIFPAEALYYEAGQTYDVSIDWSNYYGELPPSDYRLIKEYSFDGSRDKYYCICEFSIESK